MELLDIIIIGAGVYTLLGVFLKFDFFWNRGRILRTRQIIGDQRTATMYLVVGLILLGVGIWGGFFRG
ncbi:MAG: hypothetical protein KC419_24370 [Anaerolineales bacterium]|nr:hypothetical protein [Anaerolineales bacterium]